MRTWLVTGGIASGKSTVCRQLAESGHDVYDCDSRCKALYDSVPGLRSRVEETTGLPFDRLSEIFKDPAALARLEALVFPHLLDDIAAWKAGLGSSVCFIESATALSKPEFDSCYDSILLVTAPYGERLARNPKVSERARLQEGFGRRPADYIIENDSTLGHLRSEVDKFLMTMKTDLAKILTVSGTHGLYEYIAQTAGGGAIAESLAGRKRTAFGRNSRISSLSDIAIFTSEGEMKLDEVFTALHNALGDELAPSSKDPQSSIVALFEQAIPNYDADRFYVSHMKKVVDWYNELAQYASLDFLTDEEREAQAKAEAEADEEN